MRLPRARGDRRHVRHINHEISAPSPRTRGSTSPMRPRARMRSAFPAHAGIDLVLCGAGKRCTGLPRARGDRPLRTSLEPYTPPPSPRTRGSTTSVVVDPGRTLAFPAHAGIDLSCRVKLKRANRLPRARGDRPCPYSSPTDKALPSPRTRGSTRRISDLRRITAAFPAHAGIDLTAVVGLFVLWGLPRARGDRPTDYSR